MNMIGQYSIGEQVDPVTIPMMQAIDNYLRDILN